MKPALTPEEWAAAMMTGDPVDNPVDFGPIVGDRVHIPDSERHFAAALCLYGKPFGFTRADVDFIRHASEVHDEEDCGFRNSLADRIEALLPPKP